MNRQREELIFLTTFISHSALYYKQRETRKDGIKKGGKESENSNMWGCTLRS
jgi:hypothetical protein